MTHCGGQPEDVDRDPNREERVLQAGHQEGHVDGAAGPVQEDGETHAEDEVIPEEGLASHTLNVVIMSDREIEHPEQEAFIPYQGSVSQSYKQFEVMSSIS